MKKIILMSSILFAFFANSKAQLGGIVGQVLGQANSKFKGTPILTKGDWVAHLTIGTPNTVANKFKVAGIIGVVGGTDVTTNKIGPIAVGIEYFTQPNMSFGIDVGYSSGVRTASIPLIGKILDAEKLSVTQLTFTTTYHFNITDKIDPYMKGGVGVNLWGKTKTTGVTVPEPLNYNGVIGLRYFVTPNLAVNGEASFGSLNFIGNIGIAFKLNKKAANEAATKTSTNN